MRFWDASALVPLLVEEPTSPTAEAFSRADSEISVWWGTRVECASAIGRRERKGEMDPSEASLALDRLGELALAWGEVPPTERLRDIALRLVRTHELRAADALQLSAAIVAAEERPATLEVVSLDDRFALAARREGFRVLPD